MLRVRVAGKQDPEAAVPEVVLTYVHQLHLPRHLTQTVYARFPRPERKVLNVVCGIH